MAEHALIDQYLDALEREVRWTRDVDEILAEVADHLLEAVAVNLRRGLDRAAAQRRALTEFGDPALVGRAFAETRSGGIAMPTPFTRRSGVALIASSLLWLAGLALFVGADLADRSRPWEGLPQTLYSIGTLILITAGALLCIGILGMNSRHGGALGTGGRVAFWLAALTTVTAVASWMWGVWLTALGLGAVALAINVLRSGIAPRTPGLLVGFGGASAAVTAWVLQLTMDEVDLGILTTVILVEVAVYAAGLALLGAWMRGEAPVEQPGSAALV